MEKTNPDEKRIEIVEGSGTVYHTFQKEGKKRIVELATREDVEDFWVFFKDSTGKSTWVDVGKSSRINYAESDLYLVDSLAKTFRPSTMCFYHPHLKCFYQSSGYFTNGNIDIDYEYDMIRGSSGPTFQDFENHWRLKLLLRKYNIEAESYVIDYRGICWPYDTDDQFERKIIGAMLSRDPNYLEKYRYEKSRKIKELTSDMFWYRNPAIAKEFEKEGIILSQQNIYSEK